MIHSFLLLFLYCLITETVHFNGGTINWKPIYPRKNASIVPITITQTYIWTATSVDCGVNVPITTAGLGSRNANLTCMADCSTDGTYSLNPISILTDCQTVSSEMNVMTSQRSVNINLTADAHFYLAYVGTAWRGLSNPVQIDLQWSIVTYIDLRLRPDGFINTPPVPSVVSPVYAVVNQTIQITIPVPDANPGDVVRCRWAKYIAGYRRRRQFSKEDEGEHVNHNYASTIYKNLNEMNEPILIRNKRAPCSKCASACLRNCDCTCPICNGTTCQGSKCRTKPSCISITTTAETPGTIKTTSTFPTRLAIDECGGICYANNVSNSATLSNCTITFMGLIPDTWYGFALQVEDFIDSTSSTPMSSVPVQFLLYVMDEITCNLAPVIVPLVRCFDAQVGVSISFNLSATNLCAPNVSTVSTVTFASAPIGVNVSETVVSSNGSSSYATFTWTPTSEQLGSQQLCFIAYSDESMQSEQYCVAFNVITYLANCIPTTTTTTTTTMTTATTTTTSTTTTETTATISTTTAEMTTQKSELSTMSIAILAVLGSLLLAYGLALGLYWLCRKLSQTRAQKYEVKKQKSQEETSVAGDPPYAPPNNRFYLPFYGMQAQRPQYTFVNTVAPFISSPARPAIKPRTKSIIMISTRR